MSRSTALSRLSEITDLLVDRQVGIIHSVQQLHREAGAPHFFHYYAYACNTRAFSDQSNFRNAGGASVDRGLALAKAIGEAVERYCSAIYDRTDFPLCSYNRASFRCVSPDEFALYNNLQYSGTDFPYVPFTQKTPVRWAPSFDHSTNEMWHVPAAMVVLPYAFDEKNGERPIAQRISTGLACHCSFAEAAVSGICEVIERDAFTITWQARLAPPRIRLESLSEQNEDLVRRFQKVGDSVVLLNITMDVGIPTILGILCGRALEAPALVFAASADMDAERAVRKSLEELAHTRQLARQLKRGQPPLVAAPPYDCIVDKDNHVHLYCDHANVPLAEFLLVSRQSIDFDTLPNLATEDSLQDLKILIDKVQATGQRVLLADLTTADVEELGLKVVRAIIPGFHPLFMGHRLRALGGSRLWRVPQRLGYRGIDRDGGDNPAPHPYP